MSPKQAANPERAFGVSVGAVLCGIAAILLWRHRILRAEALGAVGAVLVICGLAAPRLLARPSAVWWRFSRALGHINARVLLSVLFFFVLTPVAFVWRLTGKDPLGRRRSAWPGWSPHPERYRDPGHYSRMF